VLQIDGVLEASQHNEEWPTEGLGGEVYSLLTFK